MVNINKISPFNLPKSNCIFFVVQKTRTRLTKEYRLFGSPLVGRNFSSYKYRYGFNGKENDNETVGTGQGTQDYGSRIYNPVLGRWLSLDPLQTKYPFFSPYNFCGNNPVMFVDHDGKEITPSKAFLSTSFGDVYSDLMKNNMVYRKIVSKFGGKQKDYNLKLGVDEAKVNVGTDATTTSTGMILENKLISVNSEEHFSVAKIINSKEYVSSDGKTMIQTSERTQIGIVADVIHEAIHSLDYAKKNYLDPNHDTHGKSHSILVSAMKEYRDDNCLDWSNEDIEVISWKGVQNSKAFKSYITDLAAKNNSNYDDQLKTFNSKLSKVNWKTKTEEKKVEESKTEKK